MPAPPIAAWRHDLYGPLFTGFVGKQIALEDPDFLEFRW